MLVKNPTTITVRPTSSPSYPLFTRYNENLIEVLDGVTVTGNASTGTGITISGGTIILEFALTENQNITQIINSLNLEMSRYDSYYLCFYGSSTNNADISGSLSYQINM